MINRSSIPFGAGQDDAPFGLSYHLLSEDGRDVRFNNLRSYFWQPLAPDEERMRRHGGRDSRGPRPLHGEAESMVWEGVERGDEGPRARHAAFRLVVT